MAKTILRLCVLCAWFPFCFLLEFTGWPGVCRVYPGGSCTLQWTVNPTIATDDIIEQVIFRGIIFQTDMRVLSYIARSELTAVGPGYKSRDVTYSGGGELVGFTLNDIRPSDTDSYTCRYASTPEVNNSNGVIFVWDHPTLANLKQTPDQVTVGNSVTYTCDVSSSSQPAAFRPEMTYTWYVNDTEIPGQTSHTFSIHTVTRAQWGNKYSCTGRETGSTYTSSKSAAVVLMPWYPPGPATATPRDVQVRKGSPVRLTCSLSDPGYPPGSFTWTNLSDSQVVKSCDTETCQILDTRAGIYRYQCTPHNDIGSGGGATLNLTVVYLDLVSVLPSNTTVVTSLMLTVTCHVRAFPAGDVKWSYDGSPSLPAAVRVTSPSSTPDDNYYVTQSMIDWSPSATQEQKETSGGSYTCAANNGVGLTEVTSTTELIVQFPPRVVTTSPVTNKTAYREKEDIVFSFNVTANPRPTSLNWRFISNDTNEGELTGNAKLTNGGFTLTLTSVTEDNIGRYTCVVDNGIGDHQVWFNLAAESVPDTPIDLTLSRSTSVSLTVSWIPGWDGGATQIYSVKYTNIRTLESLKEISEEHRIKVTKGITPDTEYRFDIHGVNTFGAGTAATANFTSRVQPSFDMEKLDFAVFSDEGYAILRGSIQKGSVTHIVVDACQTRPPGTCISNNITQVSLSRRRRSLPVGELISAKLNITEGGSEYQFDISLYDGPDLVNSQTTTVKDQETTNTAGTGLPLAGILGGIVAAIVVLVILAVIVFFVLRKRKPTNKETKNEHGRKLVQKKGMQNTAESAMGGYDNCGTGDDNISPYGETGRPPDLVKTANGRDERNVFEVYAEVKKEKKKLTQPPSNANETVIYAQPNKKMSAGERKEAKANSILDEDTVLVENTTYAEKPEGKNTSKKKEEYSTGLYAEVGQSQITTTSPADHNKGLALKGPVNNAGSRPAVARKPNPVSQNGSDMLPRGVGDNPYQNMEDMNPTTAASANTYGNISPKDERPIEGRQQTTGVDGIVYSELSFGNQEQQQKVIRSVKRKEDSTTYASIDIDKTGKPTIGPRAK